jgi:hypothetical protein
MYKETLHDAYLRRLPGGMSLGRFSLSLDKHCAPSTIVFMENIAAGA